MQMQSNIARIVLGCKKDTATTPAAVSAGANFTHAPGCRQPGNPVKQQLLQGADIQVCSALGSNEVIQGKLWADARIKEVCEHSGSRCNDAQAPNHIIMVARIGRLHKQEEAAPRAQPAHRPT